MLRDMLIAAYWLLWVWSIIDMIDCTIVSIQLNDTGFMVIPMAVFMAVSTSLVLAMGVA